MNTQPISKQTYHRQGTLEVHSVFYTIQGEGPYAGCPAVFVRLVGCNLQCPLCDTDYTSKSDWLNPEKLLDVVRETNRAATLVVITGGEPFRQNLIPAVTMLLDSGFAVQIETNGTYYQEGFPYHRAVTVCSPKTGKLAKGLRDNPWAIDAFKYVAQAGQIDGDGLPMLALAHPAHLRVARPPEAFNGPVYLQPVDEGENGALWFGGKGVANQHNLAACVDSCKTHGYTLCIQIHKIIGEA